MSPSATLVVPPTLDGLASASDAVRSWSERQAVDADTVKRLLTVLDELLSNVVRHGDLDGAGTIEVKVSCRDGLLEAQVSDEAAPFNPLLQPPPDTTTPLEQRRPGGLGIALVKALSDGVRYERRDNRNQLTVSWRLERT
jgi:serine/threonine-protein kinase RsbW